ncbi:unnamed protein product [Polarella glacialis]|uniref:Uncharacterized protein n=1 Tax=Polarella glacialis TaxID=89957 RepID=A0A813HP20_POLGL|nr:unnamed protein product [Polarella glacialis]
MAGPFADGDASPVSPSAQSVVQPRMLRIEVNGLLHDWFDVDEVGDMVKAPGFTATLRENIARYFGVPVKSQAVYDEDGLLATAADLSRALQRYAPKLFVYNLEEMGPRLRDKTSEQLAKIDAEVEQTRRHFRPRIAAGSDEAIGSSRGGAQDQATPRGSRKSCAAAPGGLYFQQAQEECWSHANGDVSGSGLDTNDAVATALLPATVILTARAEEREAKDYVMADSGFASVATTVPEAVRAVAAAVEVLKTNPSQLPPAPKAPPRASVVTMGSPPSQTKLQSFCAGCCRCC